jgi:hypothetical protein
MAEDPLPEPRPALKDLMASVGYLLLFWGHAERRLQGKPPPAERPPVRRLRNDLCHTLESAHAFPPDAGEPQLTCRRPDGELVIYGWSQMQEAIRVLERFNARA